MQAKKPRKQLERSICKDFFAAVSFMELNGLTANNFFITHIANELPRAGKADPKKYAIIGKHLKDMGVKSGVPDYFLTWQNSQGVQIFGWLEAKKKGGRMSAAQKEFAEKMLKSGVFFAEFHDMTEGIAILKSWGAVR